jgi:hypothetical protein
MRWSGFAPTAIAAKEPLIKSFAMRVAGEERLDARRKGEALLSSNASPSNAADDRSFAATRMGRGFPTAGLWRSSLIG